jgi:hypothetical protein
MLADLEVTASQTRRPMITQSAPEPTISPLLYDGTAQGAGESSCAQPVATAPARAPRQPRYRPRGRRDAAPEPVDRVPTARRARDRNPEQAPGTLRAAGAADQDRRRAGSPGPRDPGSDGGGGGRAARAERGADRHRAARGVPERDLHPRRARRGPARDVPPAPARGADRVRAARERARAAHRRGGRDHHGYGLRRVPVGTGPRDHPARCRPGGSRPAAGPPAHAASGGGPRRVRRGDVGLRPVHRNVAVVVRRGSVPRAAVDAVVEALLDHPAIPALAAHDPDHRPAPRSRAT